ncbi:Sds3-like-domain-containing protein [Pisolithus marmoratus]|nr:Sds3-like-domain-containing protein [Pisolithus marmoratus]
MNVPNIQDDRESNLDDAELEVEEPDEDPDLQPAHRAEALDVLATIEIKFAMLRERVYIEKMEGLAWEERLIWDETHPELHCIQEELTKRRDKRLLLAERKRRYEVQALEKKRKEEETSIWDNWEYAREQLQTELMAETNRKRRKLERERRAAERPIPVRRFPVPIRDPPPAPSLREIVNAMPLPSRLAQLIASANKKSQPDGVINPTSNSRLRFGLNGLDLNVTAHPDIPTPSPADIAGDLEYIFQHRRVGLGYPYGIFPAAPGVGFPAVGPGISPRMGFGAGVGGAATGFNNVPGVPFGMNGLAPAENYPAGVGPGVTQPGTIPPPTTGTSVPPPYNHTGMTGPGVGPADSAGFGQPPMGAFQPNIGREIAYSAGPGGPSTSGRILRPSGPPVDREWEVQTQRERELVAREHDRELAQQRDREMRERERLGEMNLRGRDREFGPNPGPGYQTSGWNSKASGGADWGLSERRRDDDIMDREREMERVDRGDRDKSQVQPGSTPTSRPQNHHSHSLPHHTHSAQSPHLTHPSHSSHSNHQAHSQPPHTLPHHQHQHPHFHSHSPHPNLHTQHQHGPTGTAPHHHHVGQPHHRRHHYHILHNHQSSGSESRVGPASGISVEGPGIKSGQGHQTPTMETINLSVNPSSKTHWKREESKYGAGSVPGSRPSSTHPPFSTYDDRDRPVATPFVLGPSQNSVSTASSPRHSWTHGEVGNSIPPGGPGAPFPPPERYHSPVPGGLGTLGMPLRASNPPPPTHHRRQSPNSLTASPSRSGPPTSPTNANLPNPVAPFCMNTSSSGTFTSQRKSSPVLLPTSKLGMSPILFSPRLTGPGVLPPTGPGVPGMLSSASTGPSVGAVLSGPPSGPGVPPPPLAIPSSTSGPGIPLPNGPGIIPQSGPGIPPAGAGDGAGVPPFTGSRRASPLISFARSGALPGQKIGVEGA